MFDLANMVSEVLSAIFFVNIFIIMIIVFEGIETYKREKEREEQDDIKRRNNIDDK